MEEGTAKEEISFPIKKLGTRHVQCLLLFLGTALGYALRVSMSVAIVAMKSAKDANPDFPEYKWDQQTSGFILSSFFWGCVVAQLPSGHLVTILSARKLLTYGMILSSAFSMLVPFLADYGPIGVICCRVAMGFCQGCLLPCVQTILAKWVPPLERSRLCSFVINGSQFGTIIAMPITGLLTTSSLGWPSVFYFFGLVGIIWSVVFYYMSSNSPSDHLTISPEEVQYINESLGKTSASNKQKLKVPWKSILTSVPVWALITVHCGNNWGFYTLLTELPTYMKNIFSFNSSKSGIMSALPYLTMWLLCFPISYFAEYAQRKGATVEVVRKVCNSIGLWIPAVALIVLCVLKTSNVAVLVTILVVAVGSNSGTFCGFHINHIDLSPNFAGPIISLTHFFANFVGNIAPLVCGAITKKNEYDPALWHTVFYITAAINLISNLLFVIFGKAEPQPWNEPESDDNKMTPGQVSVSPNNGEPTSEPVREQIKDVEQTSC